MLHVAYTQLRFRRMRGEVWALAGLSVWTARVIEYYKNLTILTMHV